MTRKMDCLVDHRERMNNSSTTAEFCGEGGVDETSFCVSKHLTVHDVSEDSEGSFENVSPNNEHSRELFWMKLLEEQAQVEGGESFVHAVIEEADLDFMSRRASLVGKEIERTTFVGDSSPLSLGSPLNDTHLDDVRLLGRSETMLTDHAAIHEKHSESCKSAYPNVLCMKAELGKIVDLNFAKSNSRRPFGDLTNSFAHVDIPTTTYHSNVSKKARADEKSTKEGGNTDSIMIKRSSHVDPESRRGRENGLCTLHGLELSNPARCKMKKNLTPSPPSQHTRAHASTTKMKRVGPNPEDHNKFRWAYDAWFQAGLITEQANHKISPSTFWQEVDKKCNRRSLSPMAPNSGSNKGQSKYSAVATLSTANNTASSGLKAYPLEDIERIPSEKDKDDEEAGFQKLLNMWRGQSKEKEKKNLESQSKCSLLRKDVGSTIQPIEKESSKSSRIQAFSHITGEQSRTLGKLTPCCWLR